MYLTPVALIVLGRPLVEHISMTTNCGMKPLSRKGAQTPIFFWLNYCNSKRILNVHSLKYMIVHLLKFTFSPKKKKTIPLKKIKLALQLN